MAAAALLQASPFTELKAREFMFLAEELALPRIPADIRPPERNVMWTILQLHYGDAKVHFELQPQPSRSLVEIGLHFESDAERNEALALQVARRTDLPILLGDSWELEEWTASWRRLHCTLSFARLTRALADEAADVMALLIRHTGEMVREMSASRL